MSPPPPPPPPPMPSWFPFKKKPKRRLSFSSFAQPPLPAAEEEEDLSSPHPPVPKSAPVKRHNSYSSGSTITSAAERLTFVTDSEKYDDIPQEMTAFHVNGKGKGRLVRGNTMTGTRKGAAPAPLPIERQYSDPPPSLPDKEPPFSPPPTTAEPMASALKRTNTKKSGWSGFGYGWGIGKQDQIAAKHLEEEEEYVPPSRSNSKSSGGSVPVVPDPPSRSNTKSSGASRSTPTPTRSNTKTSYNPPTRSNTQLTRVNTGPYGPHRTDSSSTLVGSAYERKINAPDTTPHQTSTFNQLSALRTLMGGEKERLDFYVIPHEDAHASEWIASCDKRLDFISGFTGSAGIGIVGREGGAWLVADSRYWLQASIECDENWELVKVGTGGSFPSWIEFLIEHVRPNEGMRIGIDGRMISYAAILALMNKLDHSTRLVYTTQNLVDLVWGKEKPHKPTEPIYPHPMEFAGEHASSKLRKIQEWVHSTPPEVASYNRGKDLTKKDLNVGTLIANLSSIAWVLNLRGSDLPYNPLFHSYLYIGASSILFVDPAKLSDEIKNYLDGLGVQTRPYGDIWNFIRKREWGEGKLIISPQTSYTIYLVLSHYRVTISPSPSSPYGSPSWAENLSSIKNATEIEGFRRAYLRDGAAFVKFLSWLEDKFQKGYEITEWEAAQRLTEFRRKNRNFMGLAYPPISASGANGALPHYAPSKNSSATISKKTPYLNDSGAQYLDGTTDTTRTWLFGPRPSPEIADEVIESYTRVLQGHIAIDSVVFPMGTSGKRLDVLGRRNLWKEGREYLHGTGHGTGSFLSVHEGTHSFSSDEPLVSGMLITNEPGYYLPNKFGIRLESTLVVRQLKPSHSPSTETWLGFERLTCVPIQTRMVNANLLTREEKSWIKDHNQKCLDRLTPVLMRDSEERSKKALAWLKRECARGLGISREGPGGLVVDWD